MKLFNISIRKKSFLVGLLVITAYSMLAYSIIQNKFIGFLTDALSGISVIGIAIIMYSIYDSKTNKIMNRLYIFLRFVEGVLMIVGGIFILFDSLESYRSFIYEYFHIYFFIFGALLFYILLYKTILIPRFISVWGVISVIILLLVTIIKIFGIDSLIFDILVVPIILNEVFLAIWLMIKGFSES